MAATVKGALAQRTDFFGAAHDMFARPLAIATELRTSTLGGCVLQRRLVAPAPGLLNLVRKRKPAGGECAQSAGVDQFPKPSNLRSRQQNAG